MSTQVSAAASPRFGSGGLASTLLGKNSLEKFALDTAGVYAPKAITVRSKAQLFEETYLELIEDAAFYFTIPVAGYGLSKLFQKIMVGKHPELNSAESIGKSLQGKTQSASRALIGAKSGVLLGALAIALGFEYLIQHTKNWATSKLFKINNFTAVAGLEQGRTELKANEDDGVAKAKRRIRQTAIFSGTLLAAALALPKLILKSNGAEQAARKLISYVDFGNSRPFDLSNILVAPVILSGVISYLDASRDKLERQETAMRLGVIVPYLLFGKAIVGNWLSSLIENHVKVGSQSNRKTIGEHLRSGEALSFRTGEQAWTKFKTPGTFFELGTMSNVEEFKNKLAQSNLPTEVKQGIQSWHKALTNKWISLPFILSALIAGIGINLIAYAQTRRRYHQQQEALAQRELSQHHPNRQTLANGLTNNPTHTHPQTVLGNQPVFRLPPTEPIPYRHPVPFPM